MEKINLSGIKRCNQIWEDMQPIEGDRLCASCNKCIVDFREKSNYEVALIHATSPEPICGLYTEEQLTFDIPKATPQKRKPFRHALALAASLLSLLPKIHAQEDAEKILTSEQLTIQEGNNSAFSSQENKKELVSAVKSDSIILSGRITDNNNEPLIGASILVKGHSHGTATDIDGSFILNLTKIFETQDTVTIIYSFIGYKTEEKDYNKNKLADLRENIVLEFAEILIISFGIFSNNSNDNKIESIPSDEIKQLSKLLPEIEGSRVPGVNLSDEIKFNRRSRFPWNKEFWQQRKIKRAERRKSKQELN